MPENIVKANEIKENIINVIRFLKEDCKLNEIMPLINLLKILNNKIIANNSAEDELNGHCNGKPDIDIQKNITYFVNRIHIESAIFVSIQHALESFIKVGGAKNTINKLRDERISSFEMKKLCIVTLKQMLYETNVNERSSLAVETYGGKLEYDVMGLIKTDCKVCSGILGQEMDNAIDQFCLCELNLGQREKLQAVTGLLEISVTGFIGHYDSLDVENIFKGISLPCSKRTIWTNESNCKCSGPPKTEKLMTSEHKRMVVVVIDKKEIVSSKWSRVKIDGLKQQKVNLSRAKEIELQVWEKRKEDGKREKERFMLAVVSMPLETLIERNKGAETFNMEPSGLLSCELNLKSTQLFKEDISMTKHKIKRNFSIKRKIIDFKHSRQDGQKECVKVMEGFFKNDIMKLTGCSVNNNVTDAKSTYSALCNQSAKCTITKSTLTATHTLVHERYINMLPSVYGASKLHNVNPRTVCPFYRSGNESLFPGPTRDDSGSCGVHWPLSTVLEAVPSSQTEEEEMIERQWSSNQLLMTPTSSRVLHPPVTTSTPIYKSSVSHQVEGATSTSIIHQSYRLARGMKTRSNLELSDMDDLEDLVMHVAHSDDDEAKAELQYDGAVREELNIVRVPKLVSRATEAMDSPLKCSPGLQKIAKFRIDTDSRSDSFNMCSPVGSRPRQCLSPFIDNATESTDDAVTEAALDDSADRRTGTPWSVSHEDEDGVIVAEDTSENSRGQSSVAVAVAADEGHRKMCLADLSLISVLGQGHFGKVLLAQCQRQPRLHSLCAIKVIKKSRSTTDMEYDTLMAERSILLRITALRNPFVVALIGCFQSERHVIFAIEYSCGGDLMGHIHNRVFDESTARFYGACIVLALGFLHHNDIIYRDMKLDNLLVDERGYVKLTDFGLSKEHMDSQATTLTFCGTPEFLAPEIIREQPYTRSIDWWAFGVLLYEMMLGETPFPGEEDHEIYRSILDRNIGDLALSCEAVTIIKRLLQRQPDRRLGHGNDGTDKVKSQIFFKSIDWEALAARTARAPFVPDLTDGSDTRYFEADFTNMPVTIEHEEEHDESFIDDDLFKDFDTPINWDKFVDLN